MSLVYVYLAKRLIGGVLFLCAGLGTASGAMFRCDGNLISDHPIADKGCKALGTTPVAPRLADAPVEPATPPPASGSRIEPAKPYVRPAPVAWTPPPPPDLSKLEGALPKDAEGRPILYGNGGASLVMEKQKSKTPINVLAACSGLISGCLKKDVRTIDQCFVSVPVCASADGLGDAGQCCPGACFPAYEARRIKGHDEMGAYYATFFGDTPCVPGLKGKRID